MILQAEGDSDVMIGIACKEALFRLVVMEILWTKNIQCLQFVCDV